MQILTRKQSIFGLRVYIKRIFFVHDPFHLLFLHTSSFGY